MSEGLILGALFGAMFIILLALVLWGIKQLDRDWKRRRH